MGEEASRTSLRRSAAADAALVAAAGLIAGGCSSSGSSSLACPSKPGTAVTGNAPAAAGGKPAAGWTQPGADLANTRDVASAITSSNVSTLGVAWTVPLRISTHTDGAYATTPVVVNGVVYVQDLQSDVMAVSLATGTVLWTHDYNSPNGGPDGVTVANGVVYAAAAHRLQARRHRQAPRHRGLMRDRNERSPATVQVYANAYT